MKRKNKMGRVRFPPKTVTVCSGEKKGFDYKNNHGYDKSANFWLDNISKINYKMLVILVVIYFIRVGVNKDPIGAEGLQIVCPITIQLVMNSYQCLHLLH